MTTETQTAPAQQLQPQAQQQKRQEMIIDDDPLLIAQTLTYVTDDGSVIHSFNSAPFSLCKLSVL